MLPSNRYSHTYLPKSNKTQETTNALGTVRGQFPGRSYWICTIGGQKILRGDSRWFLDFLELGKQKKAFYTTLSTVSYRDMGHGMRLRIALKIRPNNFVRKIKKFRNQGGFGTFMVAEAGLEPTTSGLWVLVNLHKFQLLYYYFRFIFFILSYFYFKVNVIKTNSKQTNSTTNSTIFCSKIQFLRIFGVFKIAL